MTYLSSPTYSSPSQGVLWLHTRLTKTSPISFGLPPGPTTGLHRFSHDEEAAQRPVGDMLPSLYTSLGKDRLTLAFRGPILEEGGGTLYVYPGGKRGHSVCISWRKEGALCIMYILEEGGGTLYVYPGAGRGHSVCISWRKEGGTPYVYSGGGRGHSVCISWRKEGALHMYILEEGGGTPYVPKASRNHLNLHEIDVGDDDQWK